MSKKRPPKGGYQVGYGKPPMRSRFRKGQSGNPSGRPRGTAGGGLKELVLKEAYRMVRVKEGDNVMTLPAIQAILRSQIALAAKGNGPAQRTLVATIKMIEQEMEAAAKTDIQAERHHLSDLDAARRIAFLLHKGQRELEGKD